MNNRPSSDIDLDLRSSRQVADELSACEREAVDAHRRPRGGGCLIAGRSG